MKSLLIALACLAVVGELALAARSNLHEWTQYKRQHGKSYESPAEDARRFTNFLASKEHVERHNAKTNSTYRMGLNHMSDWTPEELDMLNGLKLDANALRSMERANSAENTAYLAKILASSDKPIPNELDWRTVPGRVTSVKYQDMCASCWAFAAIGVLEGQMAAHGIDKIGNVSLSPQELVDCSLSNSDCYGGWPHRALDDLRSIGGTETEADYPYKAERGSCNFQKDKVVITDAGSVALPVYDETTLKEVLAKFGPVAVGMSVNADFYTYNSGVFDSQDCDTAINHAVLAVGYGTDPHGGDYWLVKNSWSPDWGDRGYFRIKRGVFMCGLGTYSVIAKF